MCPLSWSTSLLLQVILGKYISVSMNELHLSNGLSVSVAYSCFDNKCDLSLKHCIQVGCVYIPLTLMGQFAYQRMQSMCRFKVGVAYYR